LYKFRFKVLKRSKAPQNASPLSNFPMIIKAIQKDKLSKKNAPPPKSDKKRHWVTDGKEWYIL
jgi:hypothetical protein